MDEVAWHVGGQTRERTEGRARNSCTDTGDKGVSKPSHRGRSLHGDEVDMRMRAVQVNAAHHVEKKATKHHRHSRPKKVRQLFVSKTDSAAAAVCRALAVVIEFIHNLPVLGI